MYVYVSAPVFVGHVSVSLCVCVCCVVQALNLTEERHIQICIYNIYNYIRKVTKMIQQKRYLKKTQIQNPRVVRVEWCVGASGP